MRRGAALFSLIVTTVVFAFAPSHSASSVSVSFTGPTTLTGPFVVSFSAAVKAVSADNVIARVLGDTTNLPVDQVCRNAAGAQTSCMVGDVRSVRLTPRVPLIPGEQYQVVVNPSGVLVPVVDSSAQPVTKAWKTVRAALSQQENSPGAAYHWRTVTTSKALNGGYNTENLRGATFRFWFSGTSVTWYTRTGPGQGRATAIIDGHTYPTVNNYASTDHYKVPRTFGGLSSGSHRILVVVLGEKGASAGTGTFIAVDGFAVGGSIVSDPPLKFSWQTVHAGGASGDHYVRSAGNARATYRFRGRTIDWYTVTGPDQGTADMLIDGKVAHHVSNYASSRHYGVRRTADGLSDEVHTLTIVGTGGLVSIDRFVVRLPEVTIFKRLGTWVDLFDYGTSGGLDATMAAAAMRSRGVRTIYLETARYNSSSSFDFPTDVGEWVDAAHANGMKIVGWYFPTYGSYLDKDVSRTVAIASFRSGTGQHFDGLAIDIEHKTSAQSRAAWFSDIATHLARVRSKVGPAVAIGSIIPAPLAMDIYPNSWTGFPWSAIGAQSNAVLPMGYWSYRHDCSTDPSHCAYGYTAGNVTKARDKTHLPVHIIGGIGDSVSSGEVSDFVRAARDTHAYGGSLYDYRTTASTFWPALGNLDKL
jgi:hypothetical protein